MEDSVFELIAASIEGSKRMENREVLLGGLAMVDAGHDSQIEEPLAKYLAVAIEAAAQAGKIISDAFYLPKAVENKGKRFPGEEPGPSQSVDLVTQTDKRCEELIFNCLSKAFPSHKFIGEETAALNGVIPPITDEPTWIVDPVDGTANFVHSFPFVCVSIGLSIRKVPVVGVVYDPISNELFTAIKGGGAFLNGQPIKASAQRDIGKALLATEMGVDREEAVVEATTRRIKALLFKVRSLRMSGSSAMDLCGVALGRLDLFYELDFGGPWDVVAGALIVEEAGGCVFDPSGGPFDFMSLRIACSNAHLKGAFLETLAGIV